MTRTWPEVLFLPVRPNLARLISERKKTIEVRRSIPNISNGTPALIYATTPVRSVVGIGLVSVLKVGEPAVLWADAEADSGIGRREYDAYVAGKSQVALLRVEGALSLPEHIPLATIRKTWGSFQPPQSFRYVDLLSVVRLFHEQKCAHAVRRSLSGDVLEVVLAQVRQSMDLRADSDEPEWRIYLAPQRNECAGKARL
jgi:predicted transcriptional regulator